MYSAWGGRPRRFLVSRWTPHLACCALALLAPGLGGCTTQAVFLPGSGGSDFGTIDDQQGTTFKINPQADNTVRVDVEGLDGDVTFTIDADGRLTNIMLANGSNINFDYLANNRVRISGIGTFGGQQGPFDITVDISSLPRSKLLNRDQATGDPFIVCVIIDSFCDALEAFIAEWLPLVLDELIAENLPQVAAQAGIELPDGFVFPSGNPLIDGGLRFAAQVVIDEQLKPVRDFCAHWTLLRLLEISACDV